MIFLRALRMVFHLLYHQFAWTYDWVAAAVSAGLWVRWVKSIATHLEGHLRVLEVGHGPGHLMQTLVSVGHQVTGVDISPQMGRRASRLLSGSANKPALVLADARFLPFSACTFDAVVATFPAEYIAQPETWSSFRRMISPGGKIVVLLGARPGGNHPISLLSRLLFKITGQAGQIEIERARTRFAENFDRIGLTFSFHTGNVGKSETFYIIAEQIDTGDAQ